jgi:hypothetical protein
VRCLVCARLWAGDPLLGFGGPQAALRRSPGCCCGLVGGGSRLGCALFPHAEAGQLRLAGGLSPIFRLAFFYRKGRSTADFLIVFVGLAKSWSWSSGFGQKHMGQNCIAHILAAILKRVFEKKVER